MNHSQSDDRRLSEVTSMIYLCLHNLPFLIAHSKKSQGCLSILPSLRIISLRVNFEWFLISWWPTGAKFEEAKTGAPRSNLAFTVFQLFPLLLKKLHYRSKLSGKLFTVLNYLDNVLWPYSALESWLTVCPFFICFIKCYITLLNYLENFFCFLKIENQFIWKI